MAELIDRAALIDRLKSEQATSDTTSGYDIGYWNGLTMAQSMARNAPAITPGDLRPRGRWVDRYGGKYANPLYECSECKEKALYKVEVDGLGTEHIVQALSDACPNCGARMEGKDEQKE